MSELTIWTYDWVPEGPRGFVRDLRLRWACEEAGLSYAVRTVAFDGRETNHLEHQPFGQVPFLKDGDVEIFESCAGLLHLARKSDKLMPRDPVGSSGNTAMDNRRAQLDRDGHRTVVVSGDIQRCERRFHRMAGQAPRPHGEGAERAGMARRRALHRRRSVDGGCAARFKGPCFRRPTGDRGLCSSHNRSSRVQEGSSRPARSFQGG